MSRDAQGNTSPAAPEGDTCTAVRDGCTHTLRCFDTTSEMRHGVLWMVTVCLECRGHVAEASMLLWPPAGLGSSQAAR